MLEYDEKAGILELKVLAVPRASRTEVKGEHDGYLRVRVAAPPVEGAANEELVRFFAKSFGIPKSDVGIVSGAASRRKTLRFAGVSRETAADIMSRLGQ